MIILAGATCICMHIEWFRSQVTFLFQSPVSVRLSLQGFTPPLLVFVQSKERAKELFHELIYDGLNVEVIHADRTQAQRDNIIRSFRAGRVSETVDRKDCLRYCHINLLDFMYTT